MKRVDYDVVGKYCSLCDRIAKECKEDAGLYEFDDEENYFYDCDDGFVAFVNFNDDYFVNVGFLKGADAFKKCKEVLEHFLVNVGDVNIYSKVSVHNEEAMYFNSALGFNQIYKIYKYEAK